jgi:hypothetical protein
MCRRRYGPSSLKRQEKRSEAEGAAVLFQIPFYTKRPSEYHLTTEKQNETKSAGHPTVFSLWEK